MDEKINSQRVKILRAKYDEEKDLIIWHFLFLDSGTEQSFCWPSPDLLKAVGITVIDQVEPDHLHQFCKDMIGKEINFLAEGVPYYEPPKGTQEQYHDITEKMADHFDTFKDNVE